MRLADYLLGSLEAEGVRHIFGIPGDFVIKFFQTIADREHPKIITLSHEPSIGFAADAYARITNNLGVCCVTYGVGALNMVNPIAGAYAEKSPVIVLSGEPGLSERNVGILFHHEVKSFETPVRIYREITEATTILNNPLTAASEIDRVIQTAKRTKRPVYIGIPRDQIDVEINISSSKRETLTSPNPEALQEALSEIFERLNKSKSPVMVTGVEVHRFGLKDKVVKLAEKLGVPVVSTALGKATFPMDHTQFAGVYMGRVSDPSIQELVESSDCILMLGTLITDVDVGFPTANLDPAHTILAVSNELIISHHKYEEITLESIISGLLKIGGLIPRKPKSIEPLLSKKCITESLSSKGRITVNNLICQLDNFISFHKDMPLIVDCGDCLFAGIQLKADDVLCNSYYTSMGFSIPAALAVQIASGRRPLVLVGDGAFQMTGQEISHAPRYGLNPIVVLWNNGIWGMMKMAIPEANYVDLPSWPYAAMAELWGGRGFQVKTPAECAEALGKAYKENRFCLIDVAIDPDDFSEALSIYIKSLSKRAGI